MKKTKVFYVCEDYEIRFPHLCRLFRDWERSEIAHYEELCKRNPDKIDEIDRYAPPYLPGDRDVFALADALLKEIEPLKDERAELIKKLQDKKRRITEHGCLVTFNDFNRVLCHKTPYDLTDADQAREMLRFLCENKAIDNKSGQRKGAILEHLRKTCEMVATDWRPAHVFRGPRLSPLYKDAIGRNTTKGIYWINP